VAELAQSFAFESGIGRGEVRWIPVRRGYISYRYFKAPYVDVCAG